MIKKIKPDNKIFDSYEFQKDKYEFFYNITEFKK